MKPVFRRRKKLLKYIEKHPGDFEFRLSPNLSKADLLDAEEAEE